MIAVLSELFSSLGAGGVILFVVIIAICIKEIINFIDWCKKRLKQYSNEQLEEQANASNIEIRFHKDETLLEDTRKQLQD